MYLTLLVDFSDIILRMAAKANKGTSSVLPNSGISNFKISVFIRTIHLYTRYKIAFILSKINAVNIL